MKYFKMGMLILAILMAGIKITYAQGEPVGSAANPKLIRLDALTPSSESQANRRIRVLKTEPSSLDFIEEPTESIPKSAFSEPVAQPNSTEPPLPLRVQVVWAENQQPVESANLSLHLSHAGSPTARTTSGADGWAKLMAPAGATNINIQVGALGASTKSLTLLQLPNTGLVVSLKRGVAIYGTISDEFLEQPLKNMPFRLDAYSGKNLVGTIHSQTSNNGAFEISQAPPAELYRVLVGDDYLVHEGPLDGAFNTPGGKPGETLGPIEISVIRGAVLHGRVTDVDTGNPLSGVGIRILMSNPVITDASGQYTFRRLAPGLGNIFTKHDVYAEMSGNLLLESGTVSKLDIALYRGAKLLVSVLDDKGNPVEGARIITETPPDSILPLGDDVTDANGQYIRLNYDGRARPRISASKNRHSGEGFKSPTFNSDGSVARVQFVLHSEIKPDGWFTGRITDKSGKPVEAVEVVYADSENIIRVDSQGTTDHDGRYSIKTEKRPYSIPTLMARGEGWAPSVVLNTEPGDEGNPTIVDFIIEPASYLNVRVISADGKPLSKILVEPAMQLPDYPNLNLMPKKSYTTNADGYIRLENLPPAPLDLTLSPMPETNSDDDRKIVNLTRKITPRKITESKLNRDVVYRMETLTGFQGQVVDAATQKPIEVFMVKIRRFQLSNINTPKEVKLVFHDKNGNFTIHDLSREEKYYLTIVANGYSDLANAAISPVNPDEHPYRFEMNATSDLNGLLVDSASGQPLSGVTVIYFEQKPRPKSTFGVFQPQVQWGDVEKGTFHHSIGIVNHQFRTSGEDGSFSFQQGEYPGTVYVNNKTHLRKIVKPDEREIVNGRIMVRLDSGCALEGVLYEDGKPVAGKTVNLNFQGPRRNNDSAPYTPQVTDENGRFGWDPVELGEYNLFSSEPEAGIYSGNYTKRIMIDSMGLHSITLGNDLGPHTVHGVFSADSDPLRNIEVIFHPTFEWEYRRLNAITDANGHYEIKGLRPGIYTVYFIGQRENAGMFNGMKTRRVLVNGNMNYDIETGKQRKVFLELEYTGLRKDERPPVAGVVLQNKHARALHVDNPDNYTITASSEPHRKGYAFTGRILGEYQVMLLMHNTPMPILIDQMLLLDNLEKDDDAGEVVVPLMGKIRVRLNNADDSGELPKFVNITIRRTDSMATSWTENTLPLDSTSSDPVIEYYPVGDYSATLNAGDFRVTPSHVPFSVNLNGESTVDFTLSKPALSASTSQ